MKYYELQNISEKDIITMVIVNIYSNNDDNNGLP